MLSVDARIARTQRLLHMLEQDAPLLAHRVAYLAPEHQQSARTYAARLTECARGELEKLLNERSRESFVASAPAAAD